MGHTIDDLMFLHGHLKKGDNRLIRNRYQIEGENAWLDGKDADANPYNPISHKSAHDSWYWAWMYCNINC